MPGDTAQARHDLGPESPHSLILPCRRQPFGRTSRPISPGPNSVVIIAEDGDVSNGGGWGPERRTMADTVEQTMETDCVDTKVFETLHSTHGSSVQSLHCRPMPGAEEVVVNPRRPGRYPVSIVWLVSWLAVALLAIALFAADLVGVEDGVTRTEDRSLDLSIHSAL